MFFHLVKFRRLEFAKFVIRRCVFVEFEIVAFVTSIDINLLSSDFMLCNFLVSLVNPRNDVGDVTRNKFAATFRTTRIS